MAMNLLRPHGPETGLIIFVLVACTVSHGAAFSAMLPVDAHVAHGPLLLLGGRCSSSLDVPIGRVSLSRRSKREGSLVAARMSGNVEPSLDSLYSSHTVACKYLSF